MIPVPSAALEALARSYGTAASHLTHFGGGREDSDGIVYAYPHGDARRLLKVLVASAADQQQALLCLQERLRFAHFMGQQGARIAFPLPSPLDNLYETCLYEERLWIAYSMEVAPGVTRRSDDWDPGFFRNWGQAIGMLHRLARQYPSWRASLDPATGEAFLTWREEWKGFYNWCQDAEVRQNWVEIRETLDALPVTRPVFGFTHNDPHSWNLLAEGNRITLLDFDVANHHWFVNDIAIACQSVLFALSGGMDRPLTDRDKLLDFIGFFLGGYGREHHLSPEWLDRLDLFIAYRRILLFTVMYGWISSDPGRHDQWKQMILSQPPLVGPFFTAPGWETRRP